MLGGQRRISIAMEKTHWVLLDQPEIAQGARQSIASDRFGVCHRLPKLQGAARGLGHGMGSDWCHLEVVCG